MFESACRTWRGTPASKNKNFRLFAIGSGFFIAIRLSIGSAPHFAGKAVFFIYLKRLLDMLDC